MHENPFIPLYLTFKCEGIQIFLEALYYFNIVWFCEEKKYVFVAKATLEIACHGNWVCKCACECSGHIFQFFKTLNNLLQLQDILTLSKALCSKEKRSYTSELQSAESVCYIFN